MHRFEREDQPFTSNFFKFGLANIAMKIQVNARNRAYDFVADADEKILHAGLRNHVDLPYECSTGTCGTCKAKLITGEIDDAWPDAPGHKYVKAEQNEFLMCQCVARTDCAIEVADFVYMSNPNAYEPTSFKGRISKTKLCTHDVMFLEVVLEEAMDFDAGQFIVMSVPNVPGSRAYSMVNFERKTSRLDLLIKRKPAGGMSEWLFTSDRKNVVVDLIGPFGHATFDPHVAQNILCIAGGSGIAGMMSILSRAVQERYFDQYKGYLFFGVRTAKDLFFTDELSQFRNAFPDGLEIVVALSEGDIPISAEKDFPALALTKGLVHEVASKYMQGKYKNTRAYLAGPPLAVDASIRMLIVDAKLTTDNIVYDKFS